MGFGVHPERTRWKNTCTKERDGLGRIANWDHRTKTLETKAFDTHQIRNETKKLLFTGLIFARTWDAKRRQSRTRALPSMYFEILCKYSTSWRWPPHFWAQACWTGKHVEDVYLGLEMKNSKLGRGGTQLVNGVTSTAGTFVSVMSRNIRSTSAKKRHSSVSVHPNLCIFLCWSTLW